MPRPYLLVRRTKLPRSAPLTDGEQWHWGDSYLFAASRTLRAVFSATNGLPLRAKDTVAADKPSSAAMSAKVGRLLTSS